MRSISITISLLFATVSFAQTRQVCFTFDDLPVVNYGINNPEYLQSITQDLLTTLDRYHIPAIGFINEYKLYQNKDTSLLIPSRVQLLALWLQHGYALGNHTFSHNSYHRTTWNAYTQDIMMGERIIRPLTEQYQKPLTYFRHPYLHIGLSKASHDSLNYFLQQHHYVEAPVTIDNDDYIFAKAYHNALLGKDSATMQQIGKDYIDYMEEKLHYFEQVSKTLEGRNIKHILLLHANKLNADYLDELSEAYLRNQYTFISLPEALTDEAYQQKITKYGDWGISWLERWAITRGKTDILKDDPSTPEHIVKLSK